MLTTCWQNFDKILSKFCQKNNDETLTIVWQNVDKMLSCFSKCCKFVVKILTKLCQNVKILSVCFVSHWTVRSSYLLFFFLSKEFSHFLKKKEKKSWKFPQKRGFFSKFTTYFFQKIFFLKLPTSLKIFLEIPEVYFYPVEKIWDALP